MADQTWTIRRKDGTEQDITAPSREAIKKYAERNNLRDVEIVPKTGAEGIFPELPKGFSGIDIGGDVESFLGSDADRMARALPSIESVLQESGFVEPGKTVSLEERLGFGTRFDLARSNLTVDQIAKLEERGFEVQALPVPGFDQPVLIAKDQEGRSFFVDSPFDTTAGDVADFTPQPEEVIGGIAGSMVGPSAGAAAFLRGPSRAAVQALLGGARAGSVGAGEALGTGARAGIEELRGIQSQTPGEVAEEMLATGIVGTLGEGAGEALGFMGSPARLRGAVKRNLFQLNQKEMRALRIQEELTRQGFPLPELTIANFHPVARAQAAQAAAVGTRAERAVMGPLQETYEVLGNFFDTLGDPTDLSDSALLNILNAEERKIARGMKRSLAPGEAGRAAQEGIQAYSILKSEQIGRLYREALDSDDIGLFDLTEAKDVADRISNIDPFPTSEAAGRFGEESTRPSFPIRDSRFKALLDDIRAHQEVSLEGGTSTAVQADPNVVRNFRTRAFNIKDDPSLSNKEREAANELIQALNESLENPVGGSGEFQRRLRKANEEWGRFQDVIESSYIRRLAMTDTPTELGRELVRPYNVTMLRTLKKALPNEDWDSVRNGYKLYLLDNPGVIERELSQLTNADGVNLLLTPKEKQEFLNYGRERQRFQSSKIVRMANKGFADAQELFNGIRTQGKFAVDEAVRMLGGKDTPEARALQAGFLAEVLNRTTRKPKAGDRVEVDPLKAAAFIQDMDNRGIIDALFPSDTADRVRDIEQYLAVLPIASNVGDRLVTAQVAGAVRPGGAVVRPIRFARGNLDLLSHYITARILLSDESKRIVRQGSIPVSGVFEGPRAMGTIGSIMAVAASQAEADAEGVEDSPAFIPEEFLDLETRKIPIIPEAFDPPRNQELIDFLQTTSTP